MTLLEGITRGGFDLPADFRRVKNKQEVINMAHAQTCPICNGSGKVKKLAKEETCHGCGGKGWVEVSDTYPWPHPHPNPPPYGEWPRTWYRW